MNSREKVLNKKHPFLPTLGYMIKENKRLRKKIHTLLGPSETALVMLEKRLFSQVEINELRKAIAYVGGKP